MEHKVTDLHQHLRCLGGKHQWVHFAVEFGEAYEFCAACGYREGDDGDDVQSVRVQQD